jgi:hypothetical protein
MITPAGLQLDGLLSVSFQRFKLPVNGVVRDVPSSLGALAPGSDAFGNLFLPVDESEAFWIGLSTTSPPPIDVGLRVELNARHAVDALTGQPWREETAQVVEVAPLAVVAGIRRADGSSWTFSRYAATSFPVSRAVRIVLFREGRKAISSVSITLADYAMFETLTATPPPLPLDTEAGYKGWRLP